jgi:hypothetical protein
MPAKSTSSGSARRALLAASWLLSALSGMLIVAPAGAQAWGVPGTARPGGEEGLRVHLVAFENQPAAEAIKLVLPLLSPQGSVEVQPGGNTLVIRDSPESLSRILPVLAEFDHPRRRIRVVVWLFRAHRSAFSPSGVVTPNVAELSAVVETLRRHLRYADYELLTRDDAETREGEVTSLDLSGGFRVRFQVGTVLGGQRLRLNGFEVALDRAGREASSLLRSNLNLWLDRPAVVALTRPPSPGGEETALRVAIQAQVVTAASPREP